jgi:hypothetical protein
VSILLHCLSVRQFVVHAVLYCTFFMRLCKQSNRWNSCQTRIHLEDAKNLIKALIWKVCISFGYDTEWHHSARYKNIKKPMRLFHLASSWHYVLDSLISNFAFWTTYFCSYAGLNVVLLEYRTLSIFWNTFTNNVSSIPIFQTIGLCIFSAFLYQCLWLKFTVGHFMQ